MTIIKKIENWFKAAVPEPTDDNRRVQLGCHLEEVGEMADQFEVDSFSTKEKLSYLFGFDYKSDEIKKNGKAFKNPTVTDKTAFADALADQIVTAIGLAYMNGIDIEGALNEVNRSNWSKFVDGKPVFDENGKIKKGDDYTPPDLSEFVGE